MFTPNDFRFNLRALKSSDAKRQWRESIFARDSYRCSYCGSPDHLTIDHVIPRCKGGDRWDSRNCTTACRSCNQQKGSMPVARFMEFSNVRIA